VSPPWQPRACRSVQRAVETIRCWGQSHFRGRSGAGGGATDDRQLARKTLGRRPRNGPRAGSPVAGEISGLAFARLVAAAWRDATLLRLPIACNPPDLGASARQLAAGIPGAGGRAKSDGRDHQHIPFGGFAPGVWATGRVTPRTV